MGAGRSAPFVSFSRILSFRSPLQLNVTADSFRYVELKSELAI